MTQPAPILPAGFQPEAHHVAAVITAAQAMLDAFGGDTPDWLAREAGALQSALGSYWAKREQVTARPAPVAPIRIVLNLSGGVLQGASIDRGSIDLLAVDYETGYGQDDATIMDVPQSPVGEAGGTATVEGSVVALGAFDIDPAFVDAVFAAHADKEHAAAKAEAEGR